MKASGRFIECKPTFQPVSINIVFESKEELEKFTSLLNMTVIDEVFKTDPITNACNDVGAVGEDYIDKFVANMKKWYGEK